MKKPTEQAVHGVAMTIDQPGQSDVLLGRGTGPNEHIGNIRFRTLVRETIEASSQGECDRRTKWMLANKVVNTINERKGRFLKKVQNTRRGAPDVFVEVPNKVALEKTRQSFRFQVNTANVGAENEKHEKVGLHLPPTNFCSASFLAGPPRSSTAPPTSMVHDYTRSPVIPPSFFNQYQTRISDVSSLRLMDPGWLSSSVSGVGVCAGSIRRFPRRDDAVLNLLNLELQNSAMAQAVLDRKICLLRTLQAQREAHSLQRPPASYTRLIQQPTDHERICYSTY
jgi:hypothetical protein